MPLPMKLLASAAFAAVVLTGCKETTVTVNVASDGSPPKYIEMPKSEAEKFEAYKRAYRARPLCADTAPAEFAALMKSVHPDLLSDPASKKQISADAQALEERFKCKIGHPSERKS